jgi:hypothetical protein
VHHPDKDDRTYGDQITALVADLPNPDIAANRAEYHRIMVAIAHVATTAALDVGNPNAGKHRDGYRASPNSAEGKE